MLLEADGSCLKKGSSKGHVILLDVSEPAAVVFAGAMQIDLLAQERKLVFHTKSKSGADEELLVAREPSVQHWQERWDSESRAIYTRRLIWDLSVCRARVWWVELP